MTTRKTLAFALAAALLSAPFAATADAAARAHVRHVASASRHHAVKPVRYSTRATRGSSSSDYSADALNAQSLARARGQ